MLHLHGIGAEHEIAKVIYTSHHRAGLALERALAPADQSLIGFELNEYIRAVGSGREGNTEHFESSDLQARLNSGECIRAERGGLRNKRASAGIPF